MAEKQTFETALNDLEQIVARLESGDVPLEEALMAYKKGMDLSNSLQQTLKNAEETLAKIVTESGEMVDLNEAGNE